QRKAPNAMRAHAKTHPHARRLIAAGFAAASCALLLMWTWHEAPGAPTGSDPDQAELVAVGQATAATRPESVIELGSSETTNARTRVTDLVAGLHAFVVKCLDTDGDRPLPNVDVQTLPLLGGEAHRGQTGSDGRLVLRELPAGIYHVALSHEAY